MLASVQGIFENGEVQLREEPPGIERARVIVTFLPEEISTTPSDINRRMLELLDAWKDESLLPEEENALEEFDAFQARHPLRLSRLDKLT